jgi:hypothetical protein
MLIALLNTLSIGVVPSPVHYQTGLFPKFSKFIYYFLRLYAVICLIFVGNQLTDAKK